MKANMGVAHVVTAQSLASSFTGNAIAVQQADILGLQLNYAVGVSPVGDFKIQGSIDHQQDAQGVITNAGQWADLYFNVNGAVASTIAIPGSTSPILIDLYGLSVPYIRIVYVRTSGTTTFDAYLTYKRLGM